MNANFAKLDSKTIAKICRTLIVLTLLAYLVDIILISSPSFSSWNFKNNTILTDFNIFMINFVGIFFIFALLYECFYNLKEKIKTKILRYIYIALAGLLSIPFVLIVFYGVSKIKFFAIILVKIVKLTKFSSLVPFSQTLLAEDIFIGILDKNLYLSSEIVKSVILFLPPINILLLMFVFIFIDKILCKARGQ